MISLHKENDYYKRKSLRSIILIQKNQLPLLRLNLSVFEPKKKTLTMRLGGNF